MEIRVLESNGLLRIIRITQNDALLGLGKTTIIDYQGITVILFENKRTFLEGIHITE